MGVRDYLRSHPDIALWSLGVAGVAFAALAYMGYMVVYRIPDQDARQKELVSQIEKSEKALEARIESAAKEIARLAAYDVEQNTQVTRWREQLSDRVKTVHLIACEAARRRTDECARLIVMQTVNAVMPSATEQLASVHVTVTDAAKPIVANDAVATALGVVEPDPSLHQMDVTDAAKIQQTVSALFAADPSKFAVERGVIKVKFANGYATLTPYGGVEELAPMTTKLNLMAYMAKRYGEFDKLQGATGAMAVAKSYNAYTDIQRASAELTATAP